MPGEHWSWTDTWMVADWACKERHFAIPTSWGKGIAQLQTHYPHIVVLWLHLFKSMRIVWIEGPCRPYPISSPERLFHMKGHYLYQHMEHPGPCLLVQRQVRACGMYFGNQHRRFSTRRSQRASRDTPTDIRDETDRIGLHHATLVGMLSGEPPCGASLARSRCGYVEEWASSMGWSADSHGGSGGQQGADADFTCSCCEGEERWTKRRCQVSARREADVLN